jgi:hypothetical protein
MIVNSSNFRLTQYIFYLMDIVLSDHYMFRPEGHHQVHVHLFCIPSHVFTFPTGQCLQNAVKSKIHNYLYVILVK